MIKKLLASTIALIGLLTAGLFSMNNRGFSVANADNDNCISLTTRDDVVEGNNYSASTSIISYEEISALSVDIYFDENVFEVTDKYNSIPNQMYDSSIHSDHISFTYIFDSFSVDITQQLFLFYYHVKDGVTAGKYYFDIIVNEAYNPSFEEVVITTSRTYVNVENKTPSQNVYVYIEGSTSRTTSVENQFELSYFISNTDTAGGTLIIHYDDELFSFVSLEKLKFFDDKFFDYNANTAGEIYISFAASAQNSFNKLFVITFETIANVTTSSDITMTASNIYDSNLTDMIFNAQSATINISYDSSYSGAPKMSANYVIDTINRTVDINITLEAESHLGAGDFVLKFDKEVFSYVGYEKKFSPTFFLVNDKETQLSQGQVKFSIISTTDIVNATNVITFTFSYSEMPSPRYSYIDLSGSGTTDSLTNPIELDINGVYVLFADIDVVLEWADTYLYMNDPTFVGPGSGRCKSENLYITAKRALLRLDSSYIQDFQNNKDNKYTEALERYLAWAHACGDTSPFEGDGIILANNSIINTFTPLSSSMVAIVITVSSIIAVSLFVFYQKKKAN